MCNRIRLSHSLFSHKPLRLTVECFRIHKFISEFIRRISDHYFRQTIITLCHFLFFPLFLPAACVGSPGRLGGLTPPAQTGSSAQGLLTAGSAHPWGACFLSGGAQTAPEACSQCGVPAGTAGTAVSERCAFVFLPSDSEPRGSSDRNAGRPVRPVLRSHNFLSPQSLGCR